MLHSDILSSARTALVPANPLPLPIVPPELALKGCAVALPYNDRLPMSIGRSWGWSKSRSVIAKAKLTTSHIIDCCHILFPRVRLRHDSILQLFTVAQTI